MKKITTKELVAGTIGALLGSINGWLKGFYGINGPIVGIVAAIIGAFLGVIFAHEIVPDNRNRVMFWGAIGCLFGILMGIVREKGIEYIVTDGINWTALGIMFGLVGFEKNQRRVKVGAVIGAVVGFILAIIVLRPDNTNLDRPTMPGHNWLAVCVLTIEYTFLGMSLSIAFSSGKGETNIMTNKLEHYQHADAPLPATNRLWPLYGAGFENFGVDGKPITVPMPEYGPDELLVRHDACGHCFSDIKVINAGQNHPRIHRTMRERPVVLGHEVSITVVAVGDTLRGQYKVGDRFIIQADIFYKGENCSYGYEIDGGLSEYTVIDQRVLNGDHGNYLIPIHEATTGYAEAALTEPWACVIAAYQLRYRTAPRPNGTMWIIGTNRAKPMYTFSQGFDEATHPAKLRLTNVPAPFAAWLRERATRLGVIVEEVPELPDPATVETDDAPVSPAETAGNTGKGADDIILLGADADLIERASPNLASYGIMALIDDAPMARKVKVDVGRIHYNRWLYVGSTSTDITAAYSDTPARSTLKPGGRAWFVGAGGPMGRMHVQAAIQSEASPAVIVCTDVSDVRLDDLCTSFSLEAQSKGIDFICLNPMNKEAYAAGLAPFRETGFDDIMVLAPVTPVIADAATYLAPKGVMNIFAGVPRGKFADIDLSDAYLKQARVIGHSASTIENMRFMLDQAETGQLSPNRSVAAIGSLEASYDGLKAVDETRFPGKIVIYPHIKPLPLTALTELKDVLPTVAAKLKDGREWTTEAEAELLRVMLP